MTAAQNPFPSLSRRELLRASVLAAAGSALPHRLFAAPDMPAWPYDVDGDGVISERDRALVANAAVIARGFRPRPARGWSSAADFLALGDIAEDQLIRYDRLRPGLGSVLPPRPVTACWHYGWYTRNRRRHETPTVRYTGGNYLSTDPYVETDFNSLKAEFGIDADFLSWIDSPAVTRGYARGYLRAPNRSSRLIGLLYESRISLGVEGRVDFSADSPYPGRVVRDFRRMAQWLRDAVGRDGDGVLRIDGRPVVYMFGSHTFGVANRELAAVGSTLARARDEFAEAFGTLPYLIGDESIFPGDPEVGLDRRYRASYCDAVTRYHHYDEREVRGLGRDEDIRLDARYRERIRDLEERNMAGFAPVRNVFTDAPVLVIPSSAAGFAKRGLPTLRADRDDYVALLEDMYALTDAHLQALHADRLHTPALPAPLVLVGSWNEEFEGHALLPAAQNRALGERRADGFDWLLAIKSRYGVRAA